MNDDRDLKEDVFMPSVSHPVLVGRIAENKLKNDFRKFLGDKYGDPSFVNTEFSEPQLRTVFANNSINRLQLDFVTVP